MGSLLNALFGFGASERILGICQQCGGTIKESQDGIRCLDCGLFIPHGALSDADKQKEARRGK